MKKPPIPARLVYLAALSTLGLVVASSGCTLYVNDKPVQCVEDTDCTSRGPDYVGTACATAGPSSGFCVDTRSRSLNGECAANADCVDISGPGSVCVVGKDDLARCVRVLNDDCKGYLGDPFVEGTVLFGLLGDIDPGDTGYARDYGIVAAAELAIQEFQSERGIELTGKRRVALVTCSESRPRSASAHLAQLGVKAILGPNTESRLLRVAEQASAQGIPLFTSQVGQNTAATLPDASGLVFLTAPPRDGFVVALNALLPEVTSAIQTLRSVPSVRVAVVTGPGFEAFPALLRERLVFNGKTALENQNDPGCGQCYRQIDATARTPDQVADDLAAFAPHLIIPLSDVSWGTATLPLVEAKFTGPQNTRPVYLHPVLAADDVGYRSLNAADPAVRQRFLGLWPRRDDGVLAGFRERYRTWTSSGAQRGVEPNLSAGRTYETMSLLLYAAYAAGRGDAKGQVTGRTLAAAVREVTSAGATEIAPGPLSVLDAILGLNKVVSSDPKPAYGKIDFNGIYTPFDFGADQAVGNRFQVFCLNSLGQYEGTQRVIANGKTFENGTPGLCR